MTPRDGQGFKEEVSPTPGDGRSGPGATPLPATSLIIPSRNRPLILADTVASILQGDELPTELIIVDQSDEPHPELTRLAADGPCEIRYCWSRSIGSSRARNEGIESARYDILVFTDDDMHVTASWFGTLVRALIAAGRRAVVTGQVRPAEVREGGFVPSTVVHQEPIVYEGRIWADVLYPPSMAMYASLFDAVGKFDLRLGPGTAFATAEDNDLAFRALEAGYRIHYVPESVVYHRAWRTSRDYLPLKWRYAHGQGAFYAKHASLRDRYMLWRLIHDVRLRVGRCIRLAVRDPRRAAGQLVSIAGELVGFTEWLVRRPKSPMTPTAPAAVTHRRGG